MTDPDAPDVVLNMTVLVYADGYTQVSIAPTADGRIPVPLLRGAADMLARLADTAAQDDEPVDCPLCGVAVASLEASPDGHTVVRPCSHVLP